MRIRIQKIEMGCLTIFDLNCRTGNREVRRGKIWYDTGTARFDDRKDANRKDAIGALRNRFGEFTELAAFDRPTQPARRRSQDVPAVFHHAEENVLQLGITLGVAVPFGEDRGRHFDIAAELFGRVAAQKETVEESRFSLRESEVCGDFNGNELWHRTHKGKCSLPKSVSASSGTTPFVLRAGQLPFRHSYATPNGTGRALKPIQRRGCHAVLTAVGCCKAWQRYTKRDKGRSAAACLRLGVRRGLRTVEVDPEDFRRQLASKHGLWVPNFGRMQDVPLERLDEIAKALIRDAERLALAEGAGFGLGGMITLLPDASLLTAITLRLIQRSVPALWI